LTVELTIINVQTGKEAGFRIANAECVPAVGSRIVQTNDITDASYGEPDYIGKFVVRDVVHNYGFVDGTLNAQSVTLMCEPFTGGNGELF
jgi:hypothetical protein